MRRKGVSLVESLVTAMLFGLVLLVGAQLLSQYSQAIRHTSSKDQALEGALALRAVAAEVEEAISVSNPANPGSSSQLAFTRINPNFPNRLPAQTSPTPSPVPGVWAPKNPVYLMTVVYRVNAARELVREVTLPGPAVTSQVLAREVSAFQVDRNGNRMDLTASFQEQKQVRQLQLHATLKVGPWP